MLRILLAGRKMEDLVRFTAGLQQDRQTEMIRVDSAAAVLDVIGRGNIDLVVVGEDLADASPVECVNLLIRANPMLNCAMISGMDHDAFHEVTEGLGVLMQIPPSPTGDDAHALMAKLESIAAQLGGFAGKGVSQ